MSPVDSQHEEAAGRWASPRVVVVTELLTFVVMLGVAVSNLASEDPGTWERFSGLAAALVSGLALGGGITLYLQGRMVRGHMAAQHPGVPVPTSRRAGN